MQHLKNSFPSFMEIRKRPSTFKAPLPTCPTNQRGVFFHANRSGLRAFFSTASLKKHNFPHTHHNHNSLSGISTSFTLLHPPKGKKTTLPETNSSPLKIGLHKRKVLFQPSIFRGELLVSGRMAHSMTSKHSGANPPNTPHLEG